MSSSGNPIMTFDSLGININSFFIGLMGKWCKVGDGRWTLLVHIFMHILELLLLNLSMNHIFVRVGSRIAVRLSELIRNLIECQGYLVGPLVKELLENLFCFFLLLLLFLPLLQEHFLIDVI